MIDERAERLHAELTRLRKEANMERKKKEKEMKEMLIQMEDMQSHTKELEKRLAHQSVNRRLEEILDDQIADDGRLEKDQDQRQIEWGERKKNGDIEGKEVEAGGENVGKQDSGRERPSEHKDEERATERTFLNTKMGLQEDKPSRTKRERDTPVETDIGDEQENSLGTSIIAKLRETESLNEEGSDVEEEVSTDDEEFLDSVSLSDENELSTALPCRGPGHKDESQAAQNNPAFTEESLLADDRWMFVVATSSNEERGPCRACDLTRWNEEGVFMTHRPVLVRHGATPWLLPMEEQDVFPLGWISRACREEKAYQERLRRRGEEVEPGWRDTYIQMDTRRLACLSQTGAPRVRPRKKRRGRRFSAWVSPLLRTSCWCSAPLF